MRGQLGETALGVTRRTRWVVDRSEVALGVDEHVSHREVLAHANQGVVDRTVTVRVVVTHDVTDHLRALAVRRARADVVLEHRVDDPALDRLEPIAHVGQGAGDDDRHRVVDEALLHLLGDLHLGDSPVRWALCGHALVPTRCPGIARRRRSAGRALPIYSTSSPMRIEKVSSASAASSMVICSSVRVSGFIVVSHSSE